MARLTAIVNSQIFSAAVAAVVAVIATLLLSPHSRPKPRVVVAGPDVTEPQHWPPTRDAALKALERQNLHRWIDVEHEPHERSVEDTGTRALLLCKDRSVVGVVGYLNTAAADTALKVYSACHLPVIIIGATGSQLSTTMGSEGLVGLLMAPTNKIQAKFAIGALTMTFSGRLPRIGVATDTGDVKPYVEDLNSALQSLIPSTWPADQRAGMPRSRHNFTFLNDPRDSLDAIIWVGMQDGASELLNARAPGQTRPIIILSDGSVAPGGFPGVHYPQYCVWGLHPDRQPDGANPHSGWQPSYAEFGDDAGALMATLVEQAVAHNKTLTRKAVLREMRQLVAAGKPVLVGNRTYQWDRNGQLILRQPGALAGSPVEPYHFYSLEPSKGNRWLHREKPDPLTTCGAH